MVQHQETKFYGMYNDYMFKAVLQKNEDVLKHLVATLMKMDIKDIKSCQIENPIILGEAIAEEDCTLNIKLTLNNLTTLNIALELNKGPKSQKRTIFYWSKNYYSFFEANEDICIPMNYTYIEITGFLPSLERNTFFSTYEFLDEEDFSNQIPGHCIKVLDLSALDDIIEDEENRELIKWAKIFRAKNLDELCNIINESEVLKSMESTLRQLSKDEKIKQQCQARATL